MSDVASMRPKRSAAVAAEAKIVEHLQNVAEESEERPRQRRRTSSDDDDAYEDEGYASEEQETTSNDGGGDSAERKVYHEFKLSDTDDAFPTSDIKCANEGDCPVNKTSTEKSGRFKVVRLEDPDGALAEGRERAPLPPRVGCDAQPFLERILLDFQHRVTDSSGAKPIMSDVVWVRKFTDGKPRADSEYPYVVYEFQLRVSKRAAWALHKALTEGGPAESDERAVRDALAKQLLAAWPTLYKIVQGWRPRGLRTKITHRNDGPHNIVNARIVCRNDGTWKFAHDVLC